MNTIKQIAVSCLTAVLFLSVHAADVDVGDGANDNTYTDSTTYAGATKIIKTGTGKTTLNFGTYTTMPAFSGEIEVQQGTLAVYGIQNLGSPTKITVSDGATLDLTTQQTDQAANLQATEIVIEGTGVDGAGAFVRGGVTGVNNLFRTLTLHGNATIKINVQTGLGNGKGTTLGVVNLNGYTLTVSGGARFYCNNVRFYGQDGTTDDPGHLVVDGTLYLDNAYALEGGSARNTVTIKDGKSLILRNTKSLKWTVNAEGTATIYDYNSSNPTSDRDRLDGPVTFANDATLTAGDGNSGSVNSRIRFVGNNVTFNHAMYVNGLGKVVFDGANVAFTSAARVTVRRKNVATLHILGDSWMQGELNSSDFGQTRFYIADNSADARGVVILDGNSVITNFSLNIGDGGASGAFYQHGGAAHWRTGGASYDRIANSSGSYGYVGQAGGRFELKTVSSDSKTTYAAVGGTAMFAMHGGTASFENSDSIAFAFRNGGTLVYYQDNGATNTFDQGFDFGDNGDRNHSGHALVTVSGAGTELAVSKWMRFLWNNADASAIVNVNGGGTLRLQMLYKISQNVPWYLNLNGGVIKPTLTDSSFTYNNNAERSPTRAVAYEGGFVIDTSDAKKSDGTSGGDVVMILSFAAPEAEGRRVKSIALPSAAGFAQEPLVGPPLVTISGDGAGASAFALFDNKTRAVTNIVVTSPGWGYTSATATLTAGGLANAYTCAVTLEDQPTDSWKGFTKRGATRLNMLSANTFKGDVTVEDGILCFKNESAPQGGMPEGAGATIKEGAMLTFPKSSTPVTVPFLAGCGTTSYGTFTVTNRIECTADDVFAGKHLTVNQNLFLADGVKIVVTDPENLAKYRDSKSAKVVACGKTITANGTVSLAFGAPCDTEDVSRWNLVVRQNAITLGPSNGTLIIFR